MYTPRMLRAFAPCLVLAITPTLVAAERHALRPPAGPSLQRIQAKLEVGGDLKLTVEGKPKTLPMSVVAELNYDEAAAVAAGNRRLLRYYTRADAVLKVAKGGQKASLADDRRRIAIEPIENTHTLYSPQGPLTREQLDLIDVPLARLAVVDLLPNEPLAVGETWKLDENVLAAMLGLEAVDFAEVQGVFGEVRDGSAKLALAGTVRGGIGGISTQMQLKAKLAVDLKTQQPTWVALFVEEKRAIGHVGPGLDVAARLTMQLAPLTASPHLSIDELTQLPDNPNPEALQLQYRSPNASFDFVYDRSWFVTSDERDILILRLVDRGELLAQCNLTPHPTREENKSIELERFQADVQRALGKHFGQFVNAAQSVSPERYRVYRVVAAGTVEKLPIQWIYYQVGDNDGQQVTLAFTLEQELEKRFGKADRELVSAIRLRSPAAAAAAVPTPARQR